MWRSACVLVALFVWASPSRADDFHWETLADMPLGAVSPAASTSGNKLIVTGGIGFLGQTIDAIQIMDLDLLVWTRVLHLEHARFGHAQVTLHDGRVLVMGGRPYKNQRIGHAMTYCELIDLSGEPTVQPAAPLPVAMRTPTTHVLDDGRVVAIGERAVVVYDPTADAWSEPITLEHKRTEHRSIMIGPQHVLIVGGTGKQTFEVADLALKRSRLDLRVRLPRPVDDMTLAHLPDGSIWVIGGQIYTGVTTDETWIVRMNGLMPSAVEPGPSLNLPGGISDHVQIETPAGLIIAGGEAEGSQHLDTELTTTMLLDPATLSVRRLANMPLPHDDTAAVAWNGGVIVLGGQAPGRVLGIARPIAVRAVHWLTNQR